MFDLTRKVAVITGANSETGKATCERLRAAGASIILADFSDASELANRLDSEFIQTDVSDEVSVERLMRRVADTCRS